MTPDQNYPEFNQSLLAGLRAGDPHKLLMPDDPDKDTKHRVGCYLVWQFARRRRMARIHRQLRISVTFRRSRP